MLKAHFRPKDIACSIEYYTDRKSENQPIKILELFLIKTTTQASKVFWVNMGLSEWP